jgi:hypothetical protein
VQSLLSEELLDIDCRRQKLTPIDLSVALIVNVFDDAICLIITELALVIAQESAKLHGTNHARLVGVHLFKHFAQEFDFFLIFVYLVDQTMHRSPPKRRHAAEVLEPLDDLGR